MAYSYENWKKRQEKRKKPNVSAPIFSKFKENYDRANPRIEQEKPNWQTVDDYRRAREERARQADSDRFAGRYLSEQAREDEKARNVGTDRFAARYMDEAENPQKYEPSTPKETVRRTESDRFAGRYTDEAENPNKYVRPVTPKKTIEPVIPNKPLVVKTTPRSGSHSQYTSHVNIPDVQSKKEDKRSILSRVFENAKTQLDKPNFHERQLEMEHGGERDMLKGFFDADNENDTYSEKAGAGTRLGIGKTIESAGDGLNWLSSHRVLGFNGLEPVGNTIKKFGEKVSEGFEDEQQTFEYGDWNDLNYLSSAVPQAIPQLALGIVPGLGTAAWASRIQKLSKLPKLAKIMLGNGVGTGVQTSVDATIEAGGVYEEALRRGMTEEEAKAAGDDAFLKNVALHLGTNFAQIAVMRSGGLGKTFGSLGKKTQFGLRVAAGGITESFEEGAQEGIKATALGDEFSWTDPSTVEAMYLGLFLGTGVTATTSGINEIRNSMSKTPTMDSPSIEIIESALNELPPEIRQEFDEAVSELEGRDIPRNEALEIVTEQLLDRTPAFGDILAAKQKEYIASKKLEQQSTNLNPVTEQEVAAKNEVEEQLASQPPLEGEPPSLLNVEMNEEVPGDLPTTLPIPLDASLNAPSVVPVEQNLENLANIPFEQEAPLQATEDVLPLLEQQEMQQAQANPEPLLPSIDVQVGDTVNLQGTRPDTGYVVEAVEGEQVQVLTPNQTSIKVPKSRIVNLLHREAQEAEFEQQLEQPIPLETAAFEQQMPNEVTTSEPRMNNKRTTDEQQVNNKADFKVGDVVYALGNAQVKIEKIDGNRAIVRTTRKLGKNETGIQHLDLKYLTKEPKEGKQPAAEKSVPNVDEKTVQMANEYRNVLKEAAAKAGIKLTGNNVDFVSKMDDEITESLLASHNIKDGSSAYVAGKASVRKSKWSMNVQIDLLANPDQPITQEVIHEFAEVWLEVWKQGNKAQYLKAVSFLKTKGMNEARAEEMLAEILTDYTISSKLPEVVSEQGVHATFFGKIVDNFRTWVQEVVSRITFFRSKVWDQLSPEIQEQAQLFEQGKWAEAFESIQDVEFDNVDRFSVKNKGIGKKIGSTTYIHKSAVDKLDAAAQSRINEITVPKDFGEYEVIKYDKKTNNVSFIKSPDWNTNPEPIVGDSIMFKDDGSSKITKGRKNNQQIYHHKWMMVSEDYKGFDVEESKKRSEQWEKSDIEFDRKKIGNSDYWNETVASKLDKPADKPSDSVVEPTSDAWKRGPNFADVKAMYPTLFDTDPDQEQAKRHPTQVSNTVNTYNNFFNHLEKEGFEGTVLDASSGLGLGTKAGRERGFKVDDVEIYPEPGYTPKYTSYMDIKEQYDVIISSSVINVIPQDFRDSVVSDIGNKLKDGGRAFITARALDSVEKSSSKLSVHTKDARTDPNGEYFMPHPKNSFQKGFKSDELIAYVKDVLASLPGDFTVEKMTFANSGVRTPSGVTVTRKNGAKYSIKELGSDPIMAAYEKYFGVRNPDLLEEFKKNPDSFDTYYRGEIIPVGDGTQKNMATAVVKREKKLTGFEGTRIERMATPEGRIEMSQEFIVELREDIEKIVKEIQNLPDTYEHSDKRISLRGDIEQKQISIANKQEIIAKNQKELEKRSKNRKGKINELLYVTSQRVTAEAYSKSLDQMAETERPEGYDPKVFNIKTKFTKMFRFPKGEKKDGLLDLDEVDLALKPLNLPDEVYEQVINNITEDGEQNSIRTFQLFRGENALILPQYFVDAGYDAINYTEGFQDNYIVLDRSKVLYQHEWESVSPKEEKAEDTTSEQLAKEFNSKTWYHGSRSDTLSKDKIDPFATEITSLYGLGFYMTDDIEIAKNYADGRKKRKGDPSIYEIKTDAKRVLDLETVTDDSLVAAISDPFARDIDIIEFKKSIKDTDTLGDAFQKLRDELHDANLATNELVEPFGDILINLMDLGYDGYTHTGGKLTGYPEHRVFILFDPNNAIGTKDKDSGYAAIKSLEKMTDISKVENKKKVEKNENQWLKSLKKNDLVWNKKLNKQGVTASKLGEENKLQVFIPVEGLGNTVEFWDIVDIERFDNQKTEKLSAKEEILSIRKKMRDGDYTAKDLQEHFQFIKNNEKEVKDHFMELLNNSKNHKRKQKKTKEKLVNDLYDEALKRPIYGDKDSVVIRMDFGATPESEIAQYEKQVNAITDESIAKHLEKQNAEKAENQKAIDNPQTIKEFIYKANTKGLSAEEQARLDELKALQSREKDKEKKTTATLTSVSKGDYTITADKHTKTGADIWVVKGPHVEKEAYVELARYMKSLGGYYSKFKKGFIFKEDPTGKLDGEINTEEGAAESSGRDSTRIAERLRATAEKMQETIDDKRRDTRLTNTHKRARQDANAREEADAMERQQRIMKRIAEAIESGEATFLDNVTARTHIETLSDIVRLVKNERLKNVEYRSDAERNEIRRKPLTIEEINSMEIPKVRLYPGRVRDIIAALTAAQIKGISRSLIRVNKELTAKYGKPDDYLDGDLIREDMLKLANAALKDGRVKYYAELIKGQYDMVKRLEAMKLNTPSLLRSGIREYIRYTEDVGENTEQKEKDRKRKREAELAKMKITGFFPTPSKIIDRMLSEADIQPGMTVLEPSAGKGNIAERIRDEHADAKLDVVEYDYDLNEYLESLKYNVVGKDFMEHTGSYDRIIMNPPFEKGQDIDHVRHAYELLKPGGRVVAIMSEGPFFRGDKKATSFREWLEEGDGHSHKLDAGSFKDSERSTGVNTRLVVIEKPEVEAVAAGKTGETFTENGTKIEFEYQLVEAADLIASNDSNGKVNPNYPKELQPRDRSREASQTQIQNIARKLNPALLGESSKASDGAPIVGPDLVVESGNGRTIALKKMYNENYDTVESYLEFLSQNEEKFGLNPELMQHPVLVRVRTNEVDRKKFVTEANVSSIAAMSTTEQAMVDAEKITEKLLNEFFPGENGDLNVASNSGFMTGFLGSVASSSERGRLVTAKGDYSQELISRVRNAIFAKAYGNAEAISILSESTDNNIRNITSAMLQSAPKFVSMKEGIKNGSLIDADITQDIVDAMIQLSNLRKEGRSVQDFLNKPTLDLEFSDALTDAAKEMLNIFDHKVFKRSSKKLSELFNGYANELVEIKPNGLDLGLDQVTKAEILALAMKRVRADDVQISIFETESENANQTGTSQKEKPKTKVNKNEEGFSRSKEYPDVDGTETVNSAEYDKTVTRSQIVDFMQKHFQTTIGYGKTNGRLGFYKNKFAIIRTKNYGDMEVYAHEVGHRIDKRLGLSKNPKIREEFIRLAEWNLQIPEAMSKDSRAKEGVAEYFKQVFYGEGLSSKAMKIKDLSPELRKAVADGLSAQKWHKPTMELKRMMESWLNGDGEQELSGIHSPIGQKRKGKRRTPMSAINEIYTRVWNKDHPFWIASRIVEKETGLKVEGKDNAHDLAVITRGTMGRAVSFIKRYTYDENGVITGEGLEKILKKVDNIDNFDKYLIAKHALHLKTEKGKTETPITPEKIEEYLALAKPEYEALAQRLYAYQHRLLSVLVEGGLIDAKLPAELKKEYPYYVPFYRVMSEDGMRDGPNGNGMRDGQYANNQNGLKRSNELGSSKNIISPIESIIKNTHLFFSLADHNSVGRALAQLANPDSPFATEAARTIIEAVEPNLKVTEIALDQIKKTLINAGLEQEMMDEIKMDMNQIAKIFNPIFRPNPAQNEVMVWEDGKPKMFKIRDDLLYNALVAQDSRQMNDIARYILMPLEIANKSLRAGITMSPIFTLITFARSAMQLGIKTEAKGLNYFKQPGRVIKAMWSVTTRDDALYDWWASGGGQSTFIATENQYLNRELEGLAMNRKAKNMLKYRKGMSKKDKKELAFYSAKVGLGFPFKMLNTFNDILDQSIKLAEYQVVMKQTGGDRIKAALASREGDLDYNRFGSTGMQFANKYSLFWNVALQGPDNLVRYAAKNKLAFSLRGFMLVTLPTLILYWINRDDEEYQELTTQERDMNWCIPKGDGTFWKLKIPFEAGILFKTIPEKLFGEFLDWKNIKGDDEQNWKDFRKNTTETMLVNFLPTLFDVATEYLAEVDLETGRPIVPYADQSNNKPDEFNEKTSEIAKAVGKLFNKSPILLDNAFLSLTGQMGQFYLYSTDVALDKAGIVDRPDTKGLVRNYWDRQKTVSINDGTTNAVDTFYPEYERLKQDHEDNGVSGRPSPLLKAFGRANDDMIALRKVKKGMLYNTLRQPDGSVFPFDERKRRIDIVNNALRDIARDVQGLEPMDPEGLKEAWKMAEGYENYIKYNKKAAQKKYDAENK